MMKKLFLTMITMALMAINANAQEVCSFNPDNILNLDSDNGTALAAGTVIGETVSIVATIGADDIYKPQSAKFNVGGTEISGGLQGATNPKDADGGAPATTLLPPASGAFLVFEAKADGYLYVMHKASSNRAYNVFEEGTPISYTFAAIGDASTDLGAVYQFTLPYKIKNEQFVVNNSIEWAEQEYLKITDSEKYAAHQVTNEDGTVSWNAIRVNGLGVINFPVYKDCKYIVNANGSKITAAGYVFSTANNVNITSDGVVIIDEGGSDVWTVAGWTVAGDKMLLGLDWDASSSINNMITNNGEIYYLTKKDITLPKGTYEYKVFKDHSMQESYPSGNATLVIEENATYTVKFTFNSNTKELSATATKTDGLYYNYITKGKIAEVISKPNGQKYRGTVIIPSNVIYEGVEYIVNKIADNAFSGCSDLTSVSIPNSVSSIGKSAFSECSNLTSISIPNSVTSISDHAFSGCSKMTSITIPNSVSSISGYCFRGCSGLISVTIPNSVTSIDGSSFYGCSSLTSVTIPNNVTYIGKYAFGGCNSLTSVIIPNNVTSIAGKAFYGCTKLTSATIGSGVKSIEEQAFANCSKLTEVYCLAEKLSNEEWGGDGLYTDPNAFQDSYPEYMILHVPAASIEAYRTTEPWSQFKTIVAIEDGDNPEIQKCATPVISYANGKLDFTCETEGVEFVSEVKVEDAKKYYDPSVTLSQTYKVTVYATKAGYENSDIATREIVIENGQSTLFGDTNKDGNVNVTDVVKLIDIILNK